jgi:NADH-quinone oxidoreductase subunit L
VYLIGALALSGFFPLAGFWSKDEILTESHLLYPFAFWLLIAAAFLTVFYMGRQIFMVFFGSPRSDAAAHAKENPLLITVPLAILAFFAVFAGSLNLPGLHNFAIWLEHTISVIHPVEFSLVIAAGALAVAVGSAILAWWVYERRYKEFLKQPPASRPADPLKPVLGPVFVGMEQKWWIDELYQKIIVTPYAVFSAFLAVQVDWRFWHDWFHNTVIWKSYNAFTKFLAEAFDLGIIDGIANGIGRLTIRLAGWMRLLQTGYVRNYALSVFLGVILIVGYLILR